MPPSTTPGATAPGLRFGRCAEAQTSLETSLTALMTKAGRAGQSSSILTLKPPSDFICARNSRSCISERGLEVFLGLRPLVFAVHTGLRHVDEPEGLIHVVHHESHHFPKACPVIANALSVHMEYVTATRESANYIDQAGSRLVTKNRTNSRGTWWHWGQVRWASHTFGRNASSHWKSSR